MRPLDIEAGLDIPVATRCAATGGTLGVVDREVQRRQTVDLREEIGIVRNRIGAKGINDDDSLAAAIELLSV